MSVDERPTADPPQNDQQLTPQAQKAKELELARMSLIEHLGELRQRLIYSIIAIAIGVGIAWIWAEELFVFLLGPLEVAAPQLDLAKMHHKDLAEPFFALIKTSVIAGIFGAIPVVLFNIWRFIAPGLYPREKKIAIPFVIIATLFFYGGAAFCYYGVLPFGYKFLLEFGLQVSQPQLMMNEYYALTTKLMLVFGIVFELPVFAMFLSALGVITHETLLKHWRGAIIGSFVIGAFLTPADPMTQTLLAVPLCILYFVSVGVAYFFTTRQRRADAKAAEADDA